MRGLLLASFVPGAISHCGPQTAGTCIVFGCRQQRGPTVCNPEKRCVCKPGYCSPDEHRCVPIKPDLCVPDSYIKNKQCCAKLYSSVCWEGTQADIPARCSPQTEGTCSVVGCNKDRGPADCLQGRCVCKPGYCSVDEKRCVKIKPKMCHPSIFLKDKQCCAAPGSQTCWSGSWGGAQNSIPSRCSPHTKGTCAFFGCNADRGPTDCLESKCVCQPGYCSLNEEKCVRIKPDMCEPSEFLANKSCCVAPGSLKCWGGANAIDLQDRGVQGNVHIDTVVFVGFASIGLLVSVSTWAHYRHRMAPDLQEQLLDGASVAVL